MERIAQLSPFLSVAPQISEADVGVIAARGFHAILNSRPDDEGDGQPAGAAIAAAAARHGLAYRHVPVVSGKITDDDVASFARASAGLKGPVLGFCRTGTRVASLWALSEAHRLHPDAVLAGCAAAGYQLEALRARLEQRWASDAGAVRGSDGAASGTRRGDVFGGGTAGP